jgi:hypothetical protein
MPLNVNASEWQPAGALTRHLAKIKLTRGVAEKAHAESPDRSGYNTRSKGRVEASFETQEPQSPTPSWSTDIDNAIEDELQFEEMFDRVNSGHNSAHSTPRASVR